MSKLTTFLLLLCLSTFICHCFSRPINLENGSGTAIFDSIASGPTAVIQEKWWLHRGWPFVHPPMPSFDWPRKKWPYKHWPVDLPPKPWVFAKSPFPCPWWPKKDSDDEETDHSVAPPPLAG